MPAHSENPKPQMTSDAEKMKTAVVFGGAGFIGSHLLRRLSESQLYEQITCADIGEPRFVVPGVDYKRVDVREPVHHLLPEKCDEIYNLAAVHTTPGHADREYFVTNVLGAVNVCRYASRCGAATIVFTSSISVYGPVETPTDETSPARPNSAYGESKFAAEGIHRLWREELAEKRRLIIVRPAVIYGPYENGNYTRLASLLRRGIFVYPGRDDTIKACGYVEDLISSIIFAKTKSVPEITYNFAHPQRYTSKDICLNFHDVAGFRVPKIVIPLPIMLLASTPFEVLAKLGFRNSINRQRILKLTKSTNILPNWLSDNGFNFQHDLNAALREWKNDTNGQFL